MDPSIDWGADPAAFASVFVVAGLVLNVIGTMLLAVEAIGPAKLEAIAETQTSSAWREVPLALFGMALALFFLTLAAAGLVWIEADYRLLSGFFDDWFGAGITVVLLTLFAMWAFVAFVMLSRAFTALFMWLLWPLVRQLYDADRGEFAFLGTSFLIVGFALQALSMLAGAGLLG